MIDMVAILAVCLIIISASVWGLAFFMRKPRRELDLKEYWMTLSTAGNIGCDSAYAFYKDGAHISAFYGIPFEDVSCPSFEEFRKKAVEALRSSIRNHSAAYDRLWYRLNDSANKLDAEERSALSARLKDESYALASLRADLVRMLIEPDSPAWNRASAEFVTYKA